MSIQRASSSSCWKYDVFLSFRGEDTGKNFTDHLYAAFNLAGINVFREDKELERGKEISTELLKAIEESRFSVVVFSRNYALSTWCLDELVKIVECKNSRSQTVIPIFYDVDPSAVRNQRGKLQEAFAKHEEVMENIEKVEKWKTALREVANISGWDAKDRHESEILQQIVEKISSTLRLSKYRNNITGLVGLESRLEKLKKIIDAGTDDVPMMGICGMGGIEMGQQIVIKESPKKPGNRSRLWEEMDIKHVLIKNTGTKAVEGIMCEKQLNLSISAKAFQKMTNLRLLKIFNVQLPEGLEYLSDELRLLIWHGYSLKSLPSSFQPERIVELELRCSLIEQLWEGTTHWNMVTSITLGDCRNLNEVPNLMHAPNLVRLFIAGCPRLLGIHTPLLVLKRLKSLVVRDCTSLITLPGKIHMESVGNIWIVGCPKLKRFPEIAGRMGQLETLHFKGTAVREMPSSIELLTGLERLDLSSNNSLVTLPSAINNLKSLRSLSLFKCSNLESLPGTINGLISLRFLDLSLCSTLVTLPDTINGLTSLQYLVLCGCSNLVTLPNTINGLTSLSFLNLCGCSNLGSLPTTMNGLQSLETLCLDSCTKLENLPETLGEVASLRELSLSGTAIAQPVSSIFVLTNLERLSFHGCKGPPSKLSYFHFLSPLMPRKNSSPMALMLPALSDLCSLTNLDLSDCNLGEGAIPIAFFSSLLSLVRLNLSRNNFLSLPTTIRDLPKLRTLDLRDCKNLQSVPELPSSINELILNCCAALETLSNALNQCNSQLNILCVNCLKLFGDDEFILSVVKAFLKVVSIRRKIFGRVLSNGSSEVLFPGGNIPNWVRYKSEGSSISIKRPPDFYNNKLVGFILCSVFVVHKNLPFLRGNSILDAWPQCHVKTDEEEVPRISSNFISRNLKSEHIWLRSLLHEEFKKDIYNHINLSFEVKGGCGSEVKRCGIHPIYEQDLTEFNPTANQPIVNVATTYGELPEHGDDEPQPKRFKKSSSYWQNLSLLKYVYRS